MTSMEEKLVVLGQYDNAEMAHMDRISLEEAGIQAVLGEENIVSANWFYSVISGGVKLLVRQNDFGQAQRVLHEVRDSDIAKNMEDNDLVCPACDSDDVKYETFSRSVFFLSILIFKIPLPLKLNRAICHQCGHRWKQK